MKRYRVIGMAFDSRAMILNTEIKDDWTEDIKLQWQQNKNTITEGVQYQYGNHNFQNKLENFKEFGPIPFSIIAYHNKFFDQIRNAYVVGSYYPALTATCSLGERILNHLIITLRDDFRKTPQYKDVYSKNSFDNWDRAIKILNEWNVLLPDVISLFHQLKDLRNFSIHFNPNTEAEDKKYALNGIQILKRIIELQFGIGGQPLRPWFINTIPGAFYVTKEAEEWPFVKRVILPSCVQVGYKHRLEISGNLFKVIDDNQYDDKEISDDEFKDLLAVAT
ncbi:hypothetical protein [Paenibacillus puerhi]|uniref:hypothetical protein n=1 Tax=Paenibacillus puerhi TaxID=2692622 RepID=UPI00135ABA87|nr:hypothetical protein [Paenibacillus puerhi]